MSNGLTVKHRGETIAFTEFNEQWTWGDYANASLAKVKEYIDKAHKQDIAGRTAFVQPSWRSAVHERVTVTSRTEDGKEFWVKGNDGRRQKVRADSLLADTPVNEAAFAELAETQKQIRALNQLQQAIEKRLIRFTLE